ncbi:hypothetical protein FHG87_014657 [Trinorchestia longiramus]|nr:hypothetical protein FHG87_014657 [Trinorchestia longiramus]
MYSYIKPSSGDDSSGKKDDNIRSSPPSTADVSPTEDTSPSPASCSSNSDSVQPVPTTEAGYLSKAVYGLASGIYSVGSGTVGAGVSGAKWIAGTTYSVSSGVVSGAGSVVGAVASGASSVVSKASTSKSKEHCD